MVAVYWGVFVRNHVFQDNPRIAVNCNDPIHNALWELAFFLSLLSRFSPVESDGLDFTDSAHCGALLFSFLSPLSKFLLIRSEKRHFQLVNNILQIYFSGICSEV